MKFLFSALSVFVFASAVMAELVTTPSATKLERKPNASLTMEEIAKKNMELAVLYAQAINTDQQCEFEAYDESVLKPFIEAISRDPNLKSRIPSEITKAVGSRLGYKVFVSGTGYLESEKDLYGARIFVRAATSNLGGVLDFHKDRTFTETRSVWDQTAEDFKQVENHGTWEFVSREKHKRKLPSVALTFHLKKGHKTRVYSVFSESAGSFYFIKGNRGKKLDYNDQVKYLDADYTSNDGMACGD